jgi:adenine phosphoribosyltransferase
VGEVAHDATTLTALIRDIPDFPSPGIVFKDITPLLADGPAWHATVDLLAALHDEGPIDRVVGIEARGFVMGAAVAYRLGVGFVPLRKPRKLPHTTRSVTYALEYGEDTLEMHTDAVGPGERILIVDDVLATGGTAAAAADLIRGNGATVAGLVFLIELGFLGGRARLGDAKVSSLLTY